MIKTRQIRYFAILLLFFALELFSQPLPPEGGHGLGSNQTPGGGAPIGSGLMVLIGMGGAWVGRKLFHQYMDSKKLTEDV